MSKARITVTFEYEITPEWYDEGMIPEEMVHVDVTNYRDDFGSLLEVMQSHEVTVTGEVAGD